jgi:hypothetical protein
MANLLYAAQIAQQGLRDLGKGMSALGDKKSDAAAASAFRETNPGDEGEALAEGIRLGKVEVGAAEQIMNQKASLNPMTLIGHLQKVSNNPDLTDEQRLKIKKDIAGLASIMTMTAELKGKSKSGKSTARLESEIIGTGKLDTREKELMKIARKKVQQMRDSGVPETAIDNYYSSFLFKISPGTGELKQQDQLNNIGKETSEENIQDLQSFTIGAADKLIQSYGKKNGSSKDPASTTKKITEKDEATSLSDSLFPSK